MSEKKRDPAFLFYPSDFITGTLELTDEEVGQYIKTLCYQHQKGRLSIELINRLIPNISEFVLKKFDKDKQGNYYNKRLDEEIEKRSKHAEKQKENVKKRWAKKEDKNTKTIPTAYL